MSKSDLVTILKYYFGWRLALFFIAFFAVLLIPWGGTFPYANSVLIPTGLPAWIWGFGNFDGVHYLKIAQEGYLANYTQAFFPLYPVLVRILNVFPRNLNLDPLFYVDPSYFFSAFILSNLFFFLAIVSVFKLLSLDWNKKTVFGSVVLLLLFPTSFYFGSIYTESLFLFLIASSLYYARKQNFLLAGVFALLSSATKVVGVVLFPILLIEFYQSGTYKKQISENITNLIGILLAPLGILLYMVYLKISFNDLFYFLSVQPAFGASRSNVPTVLLPQVLFRYLKIFLNVPIFSQTFLGAFNELLFTLIPLLALIYLFKKMRKSYWFFSLATLLIPTLTGTLSSMPRYVLMNFLLLPYLFQSKLHKPALFIFSLLLILLTAVFIRGYWVA